MPESWLFHIRGSPQGLESHFAVNHIGDFLFTNLLVPKMVSGSRVVTVTSEAYQMSEVRFHDYNFSDGEIHNNPWKGYTQSKKASILFTVELANQLASNGILACSAHPGIVLGTVLGGGITEELLLSSQDIWQEGREGEDPYVDPLKNVQQGCATTIVAAFSPLLVEQSGPFLRDCVVQHDKVKPCSKDSGNTEQLWKLSEGIVESRIFLWEVSLRYL
jgi:NAD(P)-dependent dehydrogenase (short-subunit alcohol dehydrogenase family)